MNEKIKIDMQKLTNTERVFVWILHGKKLWERSKWCLERIKLLKKVKEQLIYQLWRKENMTDSDKEALYTWERDRIFSEYYKGTFDSIKECIEDAKSEGFKPGQMIYIGKCIEPDISCGVWFERVLEDVQDAMYSDYGDNAEDWDLSVGDIEERQEIYDKYEEKLTDLVEDYIKEIGAKPNFYDVVDIKPIIIE